MIPTTIAIKDKPPVAKIDTTPANAAPAYAKAASLSRFLYRSME